MTWDKCDERWVFQRLPTDKPEGNHITVVEDLVQCIDRAVDRGTVSRLKRLNSRGCRRVPGGHWIWLL